MTPGRARIAGGLLLLFLSILAVGRSALGTRRDSVTIDEPWHVVAGVEYVRTGDFRLNPEHPPLVKLWLGTAMPDSFRLRPRAPLVEKETERAMVEETFFHDNDFRAAQTRARAAMWCFHGLLLFVFGALLWRIFGLAWAVGALAFLAIEPTIGAHMPVVMTDLPLALTLGIAALCGGLILTTWSWGWTAAFGISLGLALGAKHSALAGLAGIALVACLAALAPLVRSRDLRGALSRLSRCALAGAIAVALLWAMYGFHFHASPQGGDGFNRPMPDKIADLKIDGWRRGVDFADHWQLLPRSYLWGLSDTVRAGVEGRDDSQFLWGKRHQGRPPWFTWPSYVLIKVPLALLALALLGVGALWRAGLGPAARWALLVLAGMAVAHFLALASSQGAYAGVRHALPIVVLLAVLAGAAVWRAWQSRSKSFGIAVSVCFAAAIAMTIGEPRLWEYHNEIVGGSANAWRSFGSEGVDLGQRAYEIDRYVREVVAPTGQTYYVSYFVLPAETRALGLRDSRKVKDLSDTNVAGIWDGYFLYNPADEIPIPEFGWDPKPVFKDLHRVARIGNVQVWKGRQQSPDVRARWMSRIVFEYIYKERGTDWDLVARRLEEVRSVVPTDDSAGIELANTYLRLGRRAAALETYRSVWKRPGRGLPQMDEDLQRQVARLESAEALATIEPLRNPMME